MSRSAALCSTSKQIVILTEITMCTCINFIGSFRFVLSIITFEISLCRCFSKKRLVLAASVGL